MVDFTCHYFIPLSETERVGFEPTRPNGQTVFKTASLWPLRYLSKRALLFYQICEGLSRTFLSFFILFYLAKFGLLTSLAFLGATRLVYHACLILSTPFFIFFIFSFYPFFILCFVLFYYFTLFFILSNKLCPFYRVDIPLKLVYNQYGSFLQFCLSKRLIFYPPFSSISLYN